MRPAAWFGFAIAMACTTGTPVLAQSPDDSLRIYGVHVVKTTPFDKPFTAHGIYIGKGAVITAAHVIGRWGFLKNPRVLVAGQDLAATIVKEGSLDDVDVTLLSIDETSLPVSLRLRRSPLCNQPPQPGESVVAVTPSQTTRSKIISPAFIPQKLRKKFNTLTGEVAEASGSGIFHAEKRCLLGIMSRRVPKLDYRKENGKLVAEPAGFAGYFVPAAQIAKFIPAEFRF